MEWVKDDYVLTDDSERVNVGGLGKWLVRCIVEHPGLQGVSMLLGTKDAHGLYEKYGFVRTEGMRKPAQ
ncbi:GNAT family N-acetyltransferase [Paenibacillus alkalitolerans]|uniref:GNAT family N-acetyltransferase n=1 Tax=Paenibacillus alkalitolerans TaxID=2799335 RepID=UPI0018F640BD|nr:GNAT family N-acetyltransferase [Paenibacillus alkalitolerans]